LGPPQHDDTGETFRLVEAVERFADELPSSLLEQWTSSQEPEWLHNLRSGINVRFIQSQRLIEQSTRANRRGATAAIVRYSQTLSALIQVTLARYAEVSQGKDRTFPQRLLAESKPVSMTRTQIHEKLVALEEKRQSLVKAGLLDVSPEGGFGASLPINDDQLNVLTIYVNDVEEKLHVFDETAAKIDLFKNIIAKLFKYKELAIDRSAGFTFSTADRAPLPLTALSSGEQHEVVLLASLLLNEKPASLFLIDEPEISLHVYWQKQFLRDLTAITSLLNVDVILATHSPQVINDRWDLTVQLGGPAGELYQNARPS
jgi:predicted ATP-binding protein involved in virulence